MQNSLFDPVMTREELIAKKNDIFKELITDEKTKFKGKGYNVLGKVEYQKDNDILLKLGVEKSKDIHEANFNKRTIKDYPNADVYFNNEKSKQYLIIQNNPDAFSESSAIVNIIKKSLEQRLLDSNLVLHIEQTFNENEFWDTLRTYQGRITALKFEFIRPNISNISAEIKESFGAIHNDLNGHTMDFNVYAPKQGILENLEPDNKTLQGLLSYNKEGGGKPPKIKAKGIRKTIKTVKSERIIEIDDYSGDAGSLIEILRNIQ